MGTMRAFTKSAIVYSVAICLRIALLFYGLWQDAHSPLKYTDIDYLVFTDAARFAATGQSPYARDTYRYTPLLAWLLWPTTWSAPWFAFGKVLFAGGDLAAGWLMVQILQTTCRMSHARALWFASIWLWNPMVATISTRGSCEGLLGALVVALLWAVLQRRIVMAGALLGLAVHFKIYPVIYATSIVWWLDDENVQRANPARSESSGWISRAWSFGNPARVTFVSVSVLVSLMINILMYLLYGRPFLEHTYLYHLTRLDHRHNFSPYNTLLYLSSASKTTSHISAKSMAFIPQIFLSLFALPLVLAKKDLPSTMLAQTFAFVTFNKVCTSQYFLWYLVFLPFYLPRSSLVTRKTLGLVAAILWLSTQLAWLQQAFLLEFLGMSTFIHGLWLSSILFFLVNSGILGIIVLDVGLNPTLQDMRTGIKVL
ncbi:GPI mannosyltransferase 1 [Podosphaera aphanis]|nr:GPI mannosyltransferase 1 [Podosphaera aphanis]